MSTTVLGCLQNAQINLKTAARFSPVSPIYTLGLEQLDNAIKALEAGRPADFVIQDSIMDDVKI